MMERANCPNCGAPIESERCPYCGTIIYDFANLELGKDCWIRLKVGNDLRVFKARVNRIMANTTEPPMHYADNTPVAISYNPEWNLELDMTIRPYDDVLMMIYKQEVEHE